MNFFFIVIFRNLIPLSFSTQINSLCCRSQAWIEEEGEWWNLGMSVAVMVRIGMYEGMLKAKTIVLVTHQVNFLHNADLILVMRDGEIVQSGKYDEVLASGSDFEALVAAQCSSMELVAHNSPDQESSPLDKLVMKRELSYREKGLTSYGGSLKSLKLMMKELKYITYGNGDMYEIQFEIL